MQPALERLQTAEDSESICQPGDQRQCVHHDAGYICDGILCLAARQYPRSDFDGRASRDSDPNSSADPSRGYGFRRKRESLHPARARHGI